MKTVNVNRMFEAIARIVSQREEGVKVTLTEVKRVENQVELVQKQQAAG